MDDQCGYGADKMQVAGGPVGSVVYDTVQRKGKDVVC
jgi:hypothetical protein